MNIIKDLYAYRELLKTNITKDGGGKYKHSFLGVLWSFLNPLLQIAVYALVFQVILKSDIENYAVYLCCGLIPWQYFSNVVIRGAAVMVDNGNIIKVTPSQDIIPWKFLAPATTYISWQMNYLIANQKARALANPKLLITNEILLKGLLTTSLYLSSKPP